MAQWSEVEPRNYKRTLNPAALVQSFMIAFVAQLSGLRAIAQRCGALLGSQAYSSLPAALQRSSSLAFVKALVALLETTHEPGPDDLVALDGMAVTLPKTQRHHCKKFNNNTVGGGVIWAFQVNARKGKSPLRVLHVPQGAWHDSKVLRHVALVPHGPLYLMDRGFYALELVQLWLDQGVHFLVRAKNFPLVYQTLRTVSAPRTIGALTLTLDALVRLGGASAKAHPVARLIRTTLPSGEELILVTDQLKASVEVLLANYKKRWHIERFHRLVKDTLGLAHLYSFHQHGIEFLLYTLALLVLLLYFAHNNPQGQTIVLLRVVLKTVRSQLGLGTPWRRNMHTRRKQHRKKQGTKKNFKTFIR